MQVKSLKHIISLSLNLKSVYLNVDGTQSHRIETDIGAIW